MRHKAPLSRLQLPALLLLSSLGLAGCNVETHKNGKNDDVSIGTPFGSMHVQTDQASAVAGLGLTPYPGAATVHKKDDDDGAADVNLSFGNFKLGVHALELQSGDAQDKVLAFYRKDMSRYGAVIACRGTKTVGQPARTAEGMTCDSEDHHNSDDDLELRAGSPQHQHIVSVKNEEGGTHIGLVALELPKGLNHHGSSEREE